MSFPLHRLLLSSFSLALVAFHVAASLSAYPTVPGADTGECSVLVGENLAPVRREVYGNGRIIDITHRITSDLPSYESMGSLGKFLWLAFSMKNGSLTNNTEMKLPAHTGTHVDAPGHVYDHYYEAGFDVDTLDLEVLNASLDTCPLPGLDAGEGSVSTGEKNDNLLSMQVYGNGRIVDITHRITPDLPPFDSKESFSGYSSA